ncbi:alpha/beta fold hydrolase [Neobacillus pocheonensis]|uniref:Alpha/beta fold hydrolase n=1 Tax=Neobacillus pocheonensis TaxID=363869 RepID=A0ABT0WFU6_9BACI|nr:alpha/beta fold hydrolase [Neobacillus pocheonensis]
MRWKIRFISIIILVIMFLPMFGDISRASADTSSGMNVLDPGQSIEYTNNTSYPFRIDVSGDYDYEHINSDSSIGGYGSANGDPWSFGLTTTMYPGESLRMTNTTENQLQVSPMCVFCGNAQLSFVLNNGPAMEYVTLQKGQSVNFTNSMKWTVPINPNGAYDYQHIEADGSIIDYGNNEVGGNSISPGEGLRITNKYDDQLIMSIPYDYYIHLNPVFSNLTTNKKTVIFIPAFLGTTLTANDGSNFQLWEPDLDNISEYISLLRLNSDGSSAFPVKVNDPLEEYYGGMITALNKFDGNKDGIPDLDVHVFPYDWRLDNRINAENLQVFINKLNVDKVTIIAHSMGGLLASKYIALGNSQKVDKLITIGTPYLGAPKGLYAFETGNLMDNFLKDYLLSQPLKAIAPNMSSAYQLLPSRMYFDINNTYYSRQVINNGWFKRNSVINFTSYDATNYFLLQDRKDWVNPSLLNDVDQFQQSLDIQNTLNSVNSYLIVGHGDKTQGLVTENFNQNLVYDNTDYEPIDGDGTVPLISASLGGRVVNENGDYYFIGNRSNTYFRKGVEHSALPDDQTVINQVLQIINGNYTAVSGMDDRAKFSQSLKVRVESPVDLNIYDQNGNHLGPVNGTQYEENIPSGTYYQSGHTKTALLEYGNYNIKLVGTGYGTATLILQKYDELNKLIKTIRFDNVDVTPKTIMTTTTDMGNSIQLVVDKNGDGNTSILKPSAVLDETGSNDQTPPSISFTIDGTKSNYNWYNSDVTLSLQGQDPESGINRMEYRLNDGDAQIYQGPIKFGQEGQTKIDAVAYNNNRLNSDAVTTNINIDKTPPTLSVSLDKNELWAPNHKLETVNAKVIANDSLSGVAKIELVSITSNEPDSGLGDIQNASYGTFDTSFDLRAERSGKNKSGRVYTITYKVTDLAGNVTTQSVNVTVSHDQR